MRKRPLLSRQRMAGAAIEHSRTLFEPDHVETTIVFGNVVADEQIDFALQQQVLETVGAVDGDENPEARALGAELGERGPEDGSSGVRAGAHSELADLESGHLVDVPLQLRSAAQHLVGMLQHERPERGRHRLPRLAVEELHAELALERLNAARERGLAELELGGGAREVLLTPESSRVPQSSQIEHDAASLSVG